MNPFDSIRDLQKSHQVVPGGVVIAVNAPMELNEVLTFAGLRYRVVEPLSREEFMRRKAENEKLRVEQENKRGFTSGGNLAGSFVGAAAEAGSGRYVDGPSPDMKYFYAMERI